ncbi:helix-turn-helix transcriptional regulator [Lactiplantibacillus fabifermentans]|uniref:AraC family transcriptional regulator n=2 Tax=Lactiplantibacillus fabifermentans TaxID=483011 RepID=A0A0R2NRW5_9LACO|nr:helix-turn-helix transcriptional regulator [Lactiplantibacillus fabifermentans]ETY74878.1 hypothetical protein LFAB_04840 [Lactiplantibacillus fabifermentans T30PCM01]KRO28389.1 AraC family transcriptional regulator [Lactiplantibacillus fabifermentans DSM 21115]
MKYYHSPKSLTIPALTNYGWPLARAMQTNKDYSHMMIIECLGPLTLLVDQQTLWLHRHDIVLVRRCKYVAVQASDDNHLRYTELILPTPEAADFAIMNSDPLLADLMHEETKQSRYLVFQQLPTQLVHLYLTALAATQKPLPDANLQFESNQLVGLIYTELLRHHRQTLNLTVSQLTERALQGDDARITQAGDILKFMHAHLQRVTLTLVATHFGYSTAYFSRLCQQLFHESFSHKVADLRLELACRLLSHTDKTVAEIATEVGWANLPNFYTRFKKMKGISPTRYRHLNRPL